MSDTFKLKNGTVLLSTEAPGGIYNSAQLKKIAELCSKELAIVKATEDQRLALFVKESEVDSVVQQLKAMGLGFRNYQAGLHQPVACLGELCDTHEQPALATATDLSKLLGSIQLESPLKIGINGCARCCTPCQTLDIAVIGEASGYRISLGGKTSQVPELATFFAEGVPAKELPKLVKKVVDLFASKAEPGESLQEVLERCGVNDFVAALAPYSQDAAGRDDPFAMDEEMAVEESPAAEEVAELSMEEGEDAPPLLDDDMLSDDLLSADETENVDIEEVPIEEGEGEALADDLSLDELREDLKHDLSAMEEEVDDSVLAEDAAVLADDEPIIDAVDVGSEEALLLDDSEMLPEELDEEDFAGEEAAADAAFEEDVDALPEVEAEAASEEEVVVEELVEVEDVADVEDMELSMDDDLPELDAGLLEEPELMEDADALALEEPSEEPANLGEAALIEEEEEGASDALMSDEEESRFEQNLQASIEEEKKMQESAPLDTNQKQREATLSFLENVGSSQTSRKASGGDKSIPLRKAPQRGFELEGVDIDGTSLRVDFTSGAYVDLDLSGLQEGESKTFRIGKQAITVTHEAQGYTLEIEGMKMFHPHLNQAS